ncbi:MAG: prephenate dehydrogenase [Eubacteriales bacterium]|uniref:prephenate dehydrogenase n=1 Tax=Faecousia sp. TaxID=2952921 RepID=UPI0029E93893|nr:prephenate dehydrogenase [Clostridiales bacterium]MDD6372763.1 prephenate dehydrogenase [Eubacteriales bacterium]MDD7259988.1 prephenate dehydrogenase [Eubacteriales bacterium]MDY6067784.1 prephenate dehydrogenase [Candidatus Faecousia sp.]
MKVGILGLGLIGGSMARAYAVAGHTVYAADLDESTLSFAMLSGAVHGRLDEETIPACELLLLAIYPGGSAKWLEDNGRLVDSGALVLDLCGIKQEVCKRCFPVARKYGFTFVGGHPMAGSHFSGFKYSRADLYKGAPMVLVPPRFDDIDLLQRVKDAMAPCGFGMFSVTTAEEHDRMIAFTSQMPHVLSNAFIKSPTARQHKGFSAGSYKDLTRVAWLNAPMWSELFLENRDNLLFELNTYLDSLTAYRDALEARDGERLTALLEAGKKAKEEVDG